MIKQILNSFFPFGLFMQMNIMGLFGGSKSKTDPAKVFGPQAGFYNQYFPMLGQMFSDVMGGGGYSMPQKGGGGIFGDLVGKMSGQAAPGSGMFSPESVVPGFTPTELAGQQAALQTAGGFQPTLGAATQGIQQLFGAADPGGELVQQAITGATAPLFEQFQNVVAPGIRRAAGGAGRTGDPKAARLAAQDLFRTTGDIGKQIALQAHQQGLGAIQGGLGQLGNLFGAQMLPSEIQRQIGAEERALQTQQSPFGIMNMFRQAAGAPIVLSGGSTSKSSPGLGGLVSFTGDV